MNDCKSDREKFVETLMNKLHRDIGRNHDKEIIRKLNLSVKENKINEQ